MSHPEIHTPRLRVLAISAASSAAAITDRVLFSRLIDADVPNAWPATDLADVEGMLAAKLTEHPQEIGWWGWYVIAKPGVVAERATLVGSVGCSRWGIANLPHFGYGVLPEYERRGFATESALALIEWVMAQPGVTRVEATTFERHVASIKILERCRFLNRGVPPDDGKAAESDRQGRGKLLLFMRERAV